MFEKLLRKLGYMKIPEYDEALTIFRKAHREKKFFIHPSTNLPMGLGITPGEFFGFRFAYTALTKKECPNYKSIG